ncbi:uncharacterized protein LOC132562635 [Ylistrum balloti]|uniref:uncharacterized protein LOC132562635 n=1 Tax=Ylistrum balloti TaxID=509963 RepID=UPI002905872A|nr:uncharacterized protein LOC132562635 [Ylistrum balloti]
MATSMPDVDNALLKQTDAVEPRVDGYSVADEMEDVADAEKNSYKIVEEMADVANVFAEIKKHNLLAVDCEGIDLGRAGELKVFTISTPVNTFIFDILKLGKQVFDDGLRDILEDKTKEKLMFDCRGDADILFHRYKVNLSGVLDLQLLEVMQRNKSLCSSSSSASGHRRSTQTDDVENIYGLQRCIEIYMDDKKMVGKEKSKDILARDKNVGKNRPLSNILKMYGCIDTSALFGLYDKLKGDSDNLPRLRIASDRYADYFRSMAVRTSGMFEHHAFLPLDIIPDGRSGSFPLATTKCVGCHRLFPRDEFSKTQLRNGNQKCRVCKKVKLNDDVQKNREDNWMRDEERRSYSPYYSSDEDVWDSDYEFDWMRPHRLDLYDYYYSSDEEWW